MGEEWLKLEQLLHRITGKLTYADGSPAAGGMIRVSYNGNDAVRIGIGVFRVALKLPLNGEAEEQAVVRGETTREYLNELAKRRIVQRDEAGNVSFTAQARESWYFLELTKSFEPKRPTKHL